jgi:hypothetical protein
VAAAVVVLPGEPEEEAGAALPPPPSPAPPSPAPAPGWRQPGDTVNLDDLITAYKFIYGENEPAMTLLDVYFAGNNHLSLEDVAGDLDVSYILRTDGKIMIKIENDDDDINPAACASLLYAGPHRALAYPPMNTHPEIASDPEFFLQSRQAFAAVASEMTVTAAELYLSGISLTNEGLDWILVINDVSEGHYQSLAAMLPFLSNGVVKASGAFLIVKNLGGEVLERIDRQALETLGDIAKQSSTQDLAVIEKLVRDHGMKDCVLKVLTTKAGPVKAPWRRAPLESNMKRALGYGPPSDFRVHHDLVWAQREWFATRGIDVNDAAFGRYVHKSDHARWHGNDGRGGPFNKFWNDVIKQDALAEEKLTRLGNSRKAC